ncbi:MAG TPA: hypothetical protein VGI58_02640 [Streptosporangiaceae bacterium]
MGLDAWAIAALADRPADALTRRDIARALLALSATEATAALPELRRQLIAAGNPLSAAFWDTAAATMQDIAAGTATVGEVQSWLESTGTEPAEIIGMHVWDDEDERSPLQAEMFRRLVEYLEGLLAAGEVDPDRLASGDPAALTAHRQRQEQWMMTPLPDGRIPMWAVVDEADDEFQAEWDAAEAEALAELRDALAEMPARPVPDINLQQAADRIRSVMRSGEWPRDLLAACGGVRPDRLPADNADLWLALAAGIVSPQDELAGDDAEPDPFADLSDDEESMVALGALDHLDWLAVATSLASGGPGTPASADDLAGFVSDYDADDVDDQADAAAGMFGHVVSLWRVLGAVDDDERLTPLGWWGIPEAVQRAWAPRE